MFRVLFSAVLVVCLAMQLIATDGIRVVVRGGPDTTVSGTLVATTMLALPEKDDVQTHSDHSATLTFAKNSVTLLGKSQIKLRTNKAELVAGGIVVSTSSRYVVAGKCFTAEPTAESETRYSVVPYQATTYIRAETGEVLVTTKTIKRTLRVPAGKTAAITNACKAGERIEFAGPGDTRYKAVMGIAAATGAIVVCMLPTQPMSAETRRVCQADNSQQTR